MTRSTSRHTVATGHPNGGAEDAGAMTPKGQPSNKDQEILWGDRTDSQGRAQSKGSSNVSGTFKGGQMGKKKGENGIRITHKKEVRAENHFSMAPNPCLQGTFRF